MRKFDKNLVGVVCVTFTFGVLATWGWARFGSVRAALVYTAGVRVLAEPKTGSVGDLIPKERSSVKFQLMNLSDRAITIWGSKSSCTCMVVDDLPRSIPARGRGEIEVAYRAGEAPGKIQQNVVLLTDDATSPQVSLMITGRITDGSTRERAAGQ
jgi:hypothetical protein